VKSNAAGPSARTGPDLFPVRGSLPRSSAQGPGNRGNSAIFRKRTIPLAHACKLERAGVRCPSVKGFGASW
jgi:hypothetical protein